MARQSTSFKKEKYAELIKNEINVLFRTKMSDPRIRPATITKVELTRDFEFATIYWDTYDASTRGDIEDSIKKLSGAIRSNLARSIRLRTVPKLIFKYDSSFDAEKKIDSILEDEKSIKEDES